MHEHASIPECDHGDIRLADGRSSNEGRVEICVDGKWGTVCNNRWDAMAALVACKQMGIPAISKTIPILDLFTPRMTIPISCECCELAGAVIGKFGPGSRSKPIMLDNVVCNGSESSLLQCEIQGINVHSCVHEEDAGVICITEETERGRKVQQPAMLLQISVH